MSDSSVDERRSSSKVACDLGGGEGSRKLGVCSAFGIIGSIVQPWCVGMVRWESAEQARRNGSRGDTLLSDVVRESYMRERDVRW